MKRNKLFLVGLTVALSGLAIPSASALTESEAKAVQAAVDHVRLPELGARAAKLVLKATPKDQEAVAVVAVKFIVSRHPATAPVVVGAVTQAAPQTGPAVAVAAVKICPDQATEIVRAAVKAAPSQADRIAAAVAKVLPKQVAKIAVAAMNVAPIAAERIVLAVGTAVPEAQAHMPRVRITSEGKAVFVNPFGGVLKTTSGGIQTNQTQQYFVNQQGGVTPKESDTHEETKQETEKRETYGSP